MLAEFQDRRGIRSGQSKTTNQEYFESPKDCQCPRQWPEESRRRFPVFP
jgi:hypothetical protein